MDGDTLYSIGDLARRTGLTVKTIRFYSDRGIVAPTGRSPAGYRRYDLDAVARLDLVRTLRDRGVDLPTIRKVVNRELPLPRQRLIGDLNAEPSFAGIRCSMTPELPDDPEAEQVQAWVELAELSQDQVGPALAARIEPASPQASPIVAALTAHYAHILGRPDDVGLRRQLLARLEAANDLRRERYLMLLAVINGWPVLESLAPVLDWSIQALGARVPR